MIWSVFEKVSQSNSRFNASDKLVIEVHSVKIPVGFGRVAIKSKGRPLSVMARLKRSIVEVKAEKYCLAHAIIIAVSKLTKDPNYDLSSGIQDSPRSSTFPRDDRHRSRKWRGIA
jgi:hypothetical protein